MTFYLHPGGDEFGERCAALAESLGFRRVDTPFEAALAIAPLLRRILHRYEWSAPGHGTLIFHPSILPVDRGPDAVRWAVQLGQRVSGVSWFWCDGGLDTGDICEQEPVALRIGESPGRAYHTRLVPAGLRALDRALRGIAGGTPRRIPQERALSTYQSFYPNPPAGARY